MFWRISVISFGLCIILILTFRELSLLPDGKLHVYILDVGQGDSILMQSPSGKNILTDGGPDLRALEHLGTHLSFLDRTIDLLILTHPDLDHITSFPDISKRYDIDTILLTGIQKDHAPRYESFLHQITQHKPSILIADPTKDIDMGDGLILDIIWPPASMGGTKPSKANNTSIVLRALFGPHAILLTGDIEKKAEQDILFSGAELKSTILKVPHHGSRTSSSTGFLLAIQPNIAIISAGRDNKFGHPHPQVVERYRSLGIPMRNTGEEGTINIDWGTSPLQGEDEGGGS